MRRLIFALALVLCAAPALAQSPVYTVPSPAGTGENGSGTISGTNTFQSVFSAAAGKRTACIVQNNGASAMWVFLGAPASATTPTSFQLSTREVFACDRPGGMALQDQISITGTAGQEFFAIQR